jgi:hypothetical protein
VSAGEDVTRKVDVRVIAATPKNLDDGRIYGAGGATELLGINPTTLASRLRALKITPPKPR